MAAKKSEELENVETAEMSLEDLREQIAKIPDKPSRFVALVESGRYPVAQTEDGEPVLIPCQYGPYDLPDESVTEKSTRGFPIPDASKLTNAQINEICSLMGENVAEQVISAFVTSVRAGYNVVTKRQALSAMGDDAVKALEAMAAVLPKTNRAAFEKLVVSQAKSLGIDPNHPTVRTILETSNE